MKSPTRSPNFEQQSAIGHSGGKLLSAGAGSGKTFVLIEHIVFLLEGLRLRVSENEWPQKTRGLLGGVVLMTFTKKAAGEMSVRLFKKIEELVDQASTDNQVQKFWMIVKKEIGTLSILTIHGFCHRLLRQGYWTNLPNEINLVSQVEHKEKLKKLFDQWFDSSNAKSDPLFIANSKELLKSLNEIFSSPELRLIWKNTAHKQTPNDLIEQYFHQSLLFASYRDLFNPKISLSELLSGFEGKKWALSLKEIQHFISSKGELASQNYEEYFSFLTEVQKIPNKAKDMPEPITEYVEKLRQLRDDLKNVIEHFRALKDNFQIFKKWHQIIFNCYSYIEDHYFDIEGFSYADLEYYVFLGLEDNEIAQKIAKDLNYIIVDEFQDTSSVQFQIIRKIIDDKWSKLFAVGDRKQAIYGFRGGEIQVFEQCARFVGESNNLYLKNNYRSESNIITFNNDLFKIVFPLGIGFEGMDHFSVEMESQNVPEEKRLDGKIHSIDFNLGSIDENVDLDQAEALILIDHIGKLLADEELTSICVLYRKLAPSKYLLENLLNKKWAFNAQVKIDYSSDPIIKLFSYLISLQLLEENASKRNSLLRLLRALLQSMQIEVECNELLEQFKADILILGLNLAFEKICLSFGISNSHYKLNFELLGSICKIAQDDLLVIHQLLEDEASENYSFEMMGGQLVLSNQKRITIMSAHASKGLEFDAVLLAGIHTNGRYLGLRDVIGKLPDSFRWKCKSSQKKFYKSPLYFLEEKILAQKDFSESKRLLYVACTRAVKSLSFVNLSGEKKGEWQHLSTSGNSWIEALRKLPIDSHKIDLILEKSTSVEIPLLLRDSMGIVTQKQVNRIGLVSELSVTRLSSLAQCPFKFYLQNICKLDYERQASFFVSESEDEKIVSSMKRGTRIHQVISNHLKDEVPEATLNAKEDKAIEWALKLAQKNDSQYEIISEKLIKFSFFGHMISGTPDVVFINKSSRELKVWDFKTGRRDETNEDGYWFQLLAYSYAYCSIEAVKPEYSIEISLLYVDEQNQVSKTFSLNEITQQLYSIWLKTESLNQVNHTHCAHCEYSSLCQRRQISP